MEDSGEVRRAGAERCFVATRLAFGGRDGVLAVDAVDFAQEAFYVTLRYVRVVDEQVGGIEVQAKVVAGDVRE